MKEEVRRQESGVRSARPGAWKAYVPLSILVLLPVYWQPRVQAGDLSSHIYNAWLAQLIEAGRTDGHVGGRAPEALGERPYLRERSGLLGVEVHPDAAHGEHVGHVHGISLPLS